MEYVPMGSEGNRYSPLSFVSIFRTWPVPALVKVRAAPGTAAPWMSEIPPKTAAVSRVCPKAAVANAAEMKIDIPLITHLVRHSIHLQLLPTPPPDEHEASGSNQIREVLPRSAPP